MTAPTPMTIPSTVRSDRIRFLKMLRIASATRVDGLMTPSGS
jgi:hypothetical protein